MIVREVIPMNVETAIYALFRNDVMRALNISSFDYCNDFDIRVLDDPQGNNNILLNIKYCNVMYRFNKYNLKQWKNILETRRENKGGFVFDFIIKDLVEKEIEYHKSRFKGVI